MFQTQDIVWQNGCIATLNPNLKTPYGALYEHSLITRRDKIIALLPSKELSLSKFKGTVVDLKKRWVTPGLIDCHTHLVFGGTRAQEWEMRLQGASYETISKGGGGILSTVQRTRLLSEKELFKASLPRLKALLAEGVTCIEIKSGYGLTLKDEIKLLKVAKKIGRKFAVDISPTLLAAHAIPPEYKNAPDSYVQYIIDTIIPAVRKKKLAESVDVFCEKIAFSKEQCERIFIAAQKNHFAIKGHMDQLSNLGGTELIAKYKGLSSDHLEHLTEKDILAMKKAGTVAVLLPGAFYFLKEKILPPVQALRTHKIPIAIASDINPGTSPFASLRLAMNQACVLFGLTPEEALQGVTLHGAHALARQSKQGILKEGFFADFVVWNIEHPSEISYSVGSQIVDYTVFRGEVVCKNGKVE